MEELKIDKNIPLPPTSRKGKLGFTEAARKMEIGDSVLFKSKSEGESLRIALERAGFKCATRKTPYGYRVWKFLHD